MPTRALLLAVLLALATAACAATWEDDFQTARRYERWGTDCWTLGGGQAAFRSGAGEAYLIAMGAQAPQAKIEADLTLQERNGPGYALAGT
ncbi:MAG: hypothetical protein WCP21_01840, partial [Armatimonadota bacterium]